MAKYVQQFFDLRCAPDILKIVGSIKNMEKEITESFGIISQVRNLLINNPMEYTVIDLCAGNALTSVLIAHMFKCKAVYSVDIKLRKNNQIYNSEISRYQYFQADIYHHDFMDWMLNITGDVLIISSHPCERAIRVVEIYKELNNDGYNTHICMIPCCIGTHPVKVPSLVQSKLGKYLGWCYSLSMYGNGLNMKVDNHIISPCNCIVSSI